MAKAKAKANKAAMAAAKKAEKNASKEAAASNKDLHTISTEVDAEAQSLGVKKSKVSYKSLKSRKPEEAAKEEKRHEKLIIQRVMNRIEKAKISAGQKPIDKRRNLLISRFKAVKSATRANTYDNRLLKAWLEEFDVIENSPKTWNNRTANGTKPFAEIGRKKTTKQQIAEMDLE